MIVTLTDGTVLSDQSPIAFCTGYRASSIEMQPGDFEKLRLLSQQNPPEQFQTVMQQLEARFPAKEPVQRKSIVRSTSLERYRHHRIPPDGRLAHPKTKK